MGWIMDDNGSEKYNSSQYLQIWEDLVSGLYPPPFWEIPNIVRTANLFFVEFNDGVPEERQLSVRFIYSTGRQRDDSVMLDELYAAAALQQGNLGDKVVGFDIVDEEDRYEKRLKIP